MTSDPESSPSESDALAKRLRVVRVAAVGTVLLFFVPAPPWEWSDSVAPFLIPIFSTPLLAILWRLRKPPYKEGLAAAMAVGGALLLFVGLGLFVAGRGSSPNWSMVAFCAVFAAVQAVLAGGAFAAYRILGYSKGDWTFMAAPDVHEPSAESRAVSAKWLRAMRGAAIGSLLLFCAPSPPWQWLENPVVLCLIVPGLALAMGAGGILCVGAGLGLLMVLSDGGDRNWSALAFLGVFVPLQAILAGSAFATYKKVGFAKGDWKLLVRGIVDPVVYFGMIGIVLAAAVPAYFGSPHYRQRETVNWMKKLQRCASAYAASHPAQGFPAQLDLLGPKGSGCIEALSWGNERLGHLFTYTPTATDPSGKVSGYALTVRPLNRARSGQKSFYLDATGTIHATSEDRPATPQDPAVP
ncbi:MAG: hypothetical protein NTW68_08575 [candidate division NC10 bacterium]|nr:hypothetical protein [candidate division NC10 bacterium]